MRPARAQAGAGRPVGRASSSRRSAPAPCAARRRAVRAAERRADAGACEARRRVRLAASTGPRRRPQWLAEPTSSARSSRCSSPLALDPARPFPKILNKSLNFAIVVEGEDGFGRNSGLAVVQAPRSLPRLIRLPDELGQPALRVPGHHRRGLRFEAVRRHEHAAAAISSASPATATCSSSRKRSTICCARSRASWPRGATATRCAWRRRTTVPMRSSRYLLEQFALTERGPVPRRRAR